LWHLAGGPKFARVIRTDEKGSDVNLATYLLFDAFNKECGAAMIISNDSDLVEPIRLVRQHFGVRIVLSVPKNKPSAALMRHADLIRPIRTGVLKASQFDEILTDAHGSFSKPTAW